MRPMVRVAVVIVLCLARPSFAQDAARMEQVIQSYVATGTFMGTVLVARDGNPVLDKAYGMANLELDVPNTPDTKFRLGSITKQFTAASILLLEERGKLNLDRSGEEVHARCAAGWDSITLFNLLTHTSGIPNFTASPTTSTIKLSSRTALAGGRGLRDRALDFEPGEKRNYSNSGYVCWAPHREDQRPELREVRERQHLHAARHEGLRLRLEHRDHQASRQRIRQDADGYENAGYIHMSIPHGAGALYSTTRGSAAVGAGPVRRQGRVGQRRSTQ